MSHRWGFGREKTVFEDTGWCEGEKRKEERGKRKEEGGRGGMDGKG
jgi:hypothetical protein